MQADRAVQRVLSGGALPPKSQAYRRLSERTGIRVAAGDWGLTTRFEYIDLMDEEDQIVQPSTVRTGGIGEIMKIAEIAYRRGLLCITHSWNHRWCAAAVHVAASSEYALFRVPRCVSSIATDF